MIHVNAVRAKVSAPSTGVRQVMGEKSVSPKFPGFRSERKQLRNFSRGGIFSAEIRADLSSFCFGGKKCSGDNDRKYYFFLGLPLMIFASLQIQRMSQRDAHFPGLLASEDKSRNETLFVDLKCASNKPTDPEVFTSSFRNL